MNEQKGTADDLRNDGDTLSTLTGCPLFRDENITHGRDQESRRVKSRKYLCGESYRYSLGLCRTQSQARHQSFSTTRNFVCWRLQHHETACNDLQSVSVEVNNMFRAVLAHLTNNQ